MLGGRPMFLMERGVFTDKFSGESVNRYLDLKGRLWLATNRWGWFRVRRKPGIPEGFALIGTIHYLGKGQISIGLTPENLDNLKPGTFRLFAEKEERR